MHVIIKLKWNWRDGNAASNEQRKSKGTFGVTSCHCILKRLMHTRWAGTLHMSTLAGYTNMGTLHVPTPPGHTAHDNTDWVHYICQQLGKAQMSNASANTAWANYMCKH